MHPLWAQVFKGTIELLPFLKKTSDNKMEQLREILSVRQIAGERHRRWFNSPSLDLVVWMDEQNRLTAFQLCYQTGAHEHALTWQATTGFNHARVDSGETGGLDYKRTPILLTDGACDAKLLRERFNSAAADLPLDIQRLILGALTAYPNNYRAHAPRPHTHRARRMLKNKKFKLKES